MYKKKRKKKNNNNNNKKTNKQKQIIFYSLSSDGYNDITTAAVCCSLQHMYTITMYLLLAKSLLYLPHWDVGDTQRGRQRNKVVTLPAPLGRGRHTERQTEKQRQTER